MGMDIYLSSDKSNLLLTLDSLGSIEKELLAFEKRTNVFIDEYGITNLYLDHIRILYELIEKPNKWKAVFEKAIALNSGLIIVGD